jgi:2',3'-cyclic-nucleotide 2'-phosphodiesterase (5'-nucleotidase family)
VVVLLGQLGRLASEDLVAAVDGVDVLVVGGDAPVIARGRVIKNTVACYGGEKGYYVCKTVLTLNTKRQGTTGEADAIMLGPEVGDQSEMRKFVKGFEDGLNEKARKAEPERAARATEQDGGGR